MPPSTMRSNAFFRDTFAGRTINLLSGNRLLALPVPLPPTPDTPERLQSRTLSRTTTLNRVASRPSVDSNSEAALAIAEKGASSHLVEWNGDDDPDNPQNWGLWTKIWVTTVVCFLTFSIYIGSAIYTAGIPGVMEDFHVSQVVATLGLSLFVFGYGLGPMIFAPFAEAPPIGRTPIYVLTHIIFIFFNFGVIYAKNIGMLLAFRFLTGFFGSPVLGIGGSSLADLWSPKKAAYAIGIWGAFAVCGPTLGPLVAGFAVQAKGWQWSIWELIWLNGFCAVFLILTLPETSADTILFRRAARLRQTTGDPKYVTAAEIEVESIPVRTLVFTSLVRPFQLCFTEPILLVQNIYLGLVYAVLYCWFEAFPIVFEGIYHFNEGTLGLAYLGLLVGMIGLLPFYFWWIRKRVEPNIYPGTTMKPEIWLQMAIVGSFWLPICLFWFGWSSRASIHWIMPIIGSVWFSVGAGLLFNGILAYQSAAYPRVVGSVLAGNDFMRAAFGGGFPLFASAMFHNLGIDWGCSLLGFLTILFIAIPIFIYKYGERLRTASKFARHDL